LLDSGLSRPATRGGSASCSRTCRSPASTSIASTPAIQRLMVEGAQAMHIPCLSASNARLVVEVQLREEVVSLVWKWATGAVARLVK
jgi:hypothetical protein